MSNDAYRWQFPIHFTGGINQPITAAWITNFSQIAAQDVHLLLTTELGYRVLNPQFGNDLRDYAFAPLDNNILTLLKSHISDIFARNLPWLALQNVSLSESPALGPGGQTLVLTVNYSVTNHSGSDQQVRINLNPNEPLLLG